MKSKSNDNYNRIMLEQSYYQLGGIPSNKTQECCQMLVSRTQPEEFDRGDKKNKIKEDIFGDVARSLFKIMLINLQKVASNERLKIMINSDDDHIKFALIKMMRGQPYENSDVFENLINKVLQYNFALFENDEQVYVAPQPVIKNNKQVDINIEIKQEEKQIDLEMKQQEIQADLEIKLEEEQKEDVIATEERHKHHHHRHEHEKVEKETDKLQKVQNKDTELQAAVQDKAKPMRSEVLQVQDLTLNCIPPRKPTFGFSILKVQCVNYVPQIEVEPKPKLDLKQTKQIIFQVLESQSNDAQPNILSTHDANSKQITDQPQDSKLDVNASKKQLSTSDLKVSQKEQRIDSLPIEQAQQVQKVSEVKISLKGSQVQSKLEQNQKLVQIDEKDQIAVVKQPALTQKSATLISIQNGEEAPKLQGSTSDVKASKQKQMQIEQIKEVTLIPSEKQIPPMEAIVNKEQNIQQIEPEKKEMQISFSNSKSQNIDVEDNHIKANESTEVKNSNLALENAMKPKEVESKQLTASNLKTSQKEPQQQVLQQQQEMKDVLQTQSTENISMPQTQQNLKEMIKEVSPNIKNTYQNILSKYGTDSQLKCSEENKQITDQPQDSKLDVNASKKQLSTSDLKVSQKEQRIDSLPIEQAQQVQKVSEVKISLKRSQDKDPFDEKDQIAVVKQPALTQKSATLISIQNGEEAPKLQGSTSDVKASKQKQMQIEQIKEVTLIPSEKQIPPMEAIVNKEQNIQQIEPEKKAMQISFSNSKSQNIDAEDNHIKANEDTEVKNSNLALENAMKPKEVESKQLTASNLKTSQKEPQQQVLQQQQEVKDVLINSKPTYQKQKETETQSTEDIPAPQNQGSLQQKTEVAKPLQDTAVQNTKPAPKIKFLNQSKHEHKREEEKTQTNINQQTVSECKAGETNEKVEQKQPNVASETNLQMQNEQKVEEKQIKTSPTKPEIQKEKQTRRFRGDYNSKNQIVEFIKDMGMDQNNDRFNIQVEVHLTGEEIVELMELFTGCGMKLEVE